MRLVVPILASLFLASPASAAKPGVEQGLLVTHQWGPIETTVEGSDPVLILQAGYWRTWRLKESPVSIGYRFAPGLRVAGNWGMNGVWSQAQFLTRLRAPNGIPYAAVGVGAELWWVFPFPGVSAEVGVSVPVGSFHLNLSGQGRAHIAFSDGVVLSAGPVLEFSWGPAP